jgi:hypothetical protein
MNNSKTMKLLLAASAGLLAVSTQASNLKIDETGGTKGDIFKFDNGTWDNVVETVDTSVAGQEKFVFEADLKNGDLASGSSSIALKDSDNTVSDVLKASWTFVQDTDRKSHDHFVITLWSDGGWPSVPDASTPELDGMTKYLQVGTAPSDVNIFVNSPEVETHHVTPDGGMTLALLGTAVSAVALIRRKLS